MLTGRTLMGHESAKNQQLEDHYFGAIPTRCLLYTSEASSQGMIQRRLFDFLEQMSNVEDLRGKYF